MHGIFLNFLLMVGKVMQWSSTLKSFDFNVGSSCIWLALDSTAKNYTTITNLLFLVVFSDKLNIQACMRYKKKTKKKNPKGRYKCMVHACFQGNAVAICV